MRILSLKARGFIGFKKGLGLDEIDVDFKNLSGLVALAGPNGHGKSTMLENLSPFRTLASRGGALRHHTFLRDSYKELEFEMMGDIYRTLIKIDADSDRSEGFIWKNGEPQIDGKVSNYNNYLVKLLGTANLFYNSVFCAQNSQRLSDMTTGDLKSLFTEFLRLDRLALYERNSKQCISVIESMKGIAERRAESLKERLEKLTDTVSMIENLNKDRDDALAEIESLKQSIINTEVNIHVLTQAIVKNGELEKEAKGIDEALLVIRNSLSQHVTHGEDKSRYFTREIDNLGNQILECNQILLEREAIEKAGEVVKNKEREIDSWVKEIQDWTDEKKVVTDQYVKLSSTINELKIRLSTTNNAPHISNIEKKIVDIERKIDADKSEINRLEVLKPHTLSTQAIIQLKNEIKTCQSQMGLLDRRDPNCQSQTCAFILSGIEAQKRIPALETELKRLTTEAQEKVAAIDAELEVFSAQITKLSEERIKNTEIIKIKREELLKAVSDIENSLAQPQMELDEVIDRGKVLSKDIQGGEIAIKILREEKANSEKLAAKLPQLEVKSALHAELVRQLSSINKDRERWNSEHARQKKSFIQSITKYETQLKEVQDKKVMNAEIEMQAAKQRLISLQHTMNSLETKIAEINAEISKNKAKVEEKADAEKELAAVEAEAASYSKDISDWTYIRNACGKNGLQALEIDGVAPLIANYANDLLMQSFGPNFTVKLVTQDQLTGKETLDIIVIRGDGSEVLLENLSGGEKVWILKALRLAMTLVSKQKSGRNFQSFFSDEEDGALDGEKALNFVGLYRSLMATGNFDICYYISHNPDVVAMADHQILFSASDVKVV